MSDTDALRAYAAEKAAEVAEQWASHSALAKLETARAVAASRARHLRTVAMQYDPTHEPLERAAAFAAARGAFAEFHDADAAWLRRARRQSQSATEELETALAAALAHLSDLGRGDLVTAYFETRVALDAALELETRYRCRDLDLEALTETP